MRAVLFGAVAVVNAWSGAEQFERWSHFKDYGVPGTVTDPLNRAAIADGTCRLLGHKFDGYKFWHHSSSVDAVIDALNNTGSTSQPSYFVLDANRALSGPCTSTSTSKDDQEKFTLEGLTGGIQNWYHALCAPEN